MQRTSPGKQPTNDPQSSSFANSNAGVFPAQATPSPLPPSSLFYSPLYGQRSLDRSREILKDKHPKLFYPQGYLDVQGWLILQVSQWTRTNHELIHRLMVDTKYEPDSCHSRRRKKSTSNLDPT